MVPFHLRGFDVYSVVASGWACNNMTEEEVLKMFGERFSLIKIMRDFFLKIKKVEDLEWAFDEAKNIWEKYGF